MPIGKRLRFSIFDRDCFTCQYCGKKPPDAILHVDHMISKKDGGGDEEENLITSCRDCNLGKSAKSVDIKKVKNSSFKKKISEIEEKKAQLDAYYNYIKKRDELDFEETNIFQKRWQDCSNDSNRLTDRGVKDIAKLTSKYSTEMILDAIKIAWESAHVSEDGKFKYVCGILKNMKAGEESPEKADEIKIKNKLRATASSRFYVNENYMRQLLLDINIETAEYLIENIDMFRNWTSFKEFCNLDVYAE